jgi:hypothetical protein
MSYLREFYLKPEDDPAYNQDQLEVYDDLEACLQQLKMTLFTNKGEVLGEEDFGVDLNKYLFDFDIDPFGITRDATQQIERYVTEAKKRNITLEPNIYEDTVSNRDVFVLGINIPELKAPLSIFYD